jgi:hypothetical protein
MPLTTTSEKSPRASRSRIALTAHPLGHAVRFAPHGAPAPHDARDAHTARQARAWATAHGALARYTDPGGRLREVLARPGHAGSVLVLDRDATTLGDRRLVAHLAADEPVENASLVCHHYLRDPHRHRCRPVNPEDLLTAPFPEGHVGCERSLTPPPRAARLLDRHGRLHRLEVCDAGMSIPELRWRWRWSKTEPQESAELGEGGDLVEIDRSELEGAQPDGSGWPESVRDAVGCLESYEPVRALTARAVARHRGDSTVSVAVLRGELQRLDASRIVLNRGLRQAVLRALRTQGLSLSEIAYRCGRVKRDGRGNASGETSWLSRRVGIAPEGGGGEPTPWIHSEVLALIARRGLGISPREVEL